ncbi:MAG: ectoine hydroxylase-related dioxygenase (phytanoyl-CoA dioxygenase family) [Candidatus Azotimanducaceae bacterium]|jgi:ectoine hydroxylase-related dioxygenase (phytanoyl-CoA dioxygenase family)|tara:strand:+ start:18488 stop:19438 length:951 start_codon:yes stop_codon:yes gene_type:complete
MHKPSEKQTPYVQDQELEGPVILPLPKATQDLLQAQEDLRTHGCCIVNNVLDDNTVSDLKARMDRQFDAEQALGEQCPDRGTSNKIVIPNLVNKGKHYLDLVERHETESLAGFLLGKDFLLSSLTAHMFLGTTPAIELIHRDQGQIPAAVEFPAIFNLFYTLDDFTPQRGSTVVFPGSHRWPVNHRVHPPKAELGHQVNLAAGSLFAFDGRLWHGTGANLEGHRRRAISVFCCAPWVRQQENAAAATSHDIFDAASPKLRARLGLKTYGTLGNINGTRIEHQRIAFGNVDVAFPNELIGENAELIPLQQSRKPDDA